MKTRLETMMRALALCFALCFGLLIFAPTASAELQMSATFSDHMVIQQGQPVPVWGIASPGAKVTVQFKGKDSITTADARGRWRVTLDAQKASSEPAELLVRAGNDARTIKDVLVGEVWLCSGQSNMALRLANSLDAEKAAAAANDPLLRTFNVAQRPAERPAEVLKDGEWLVCGPTTAPEFSAVSYYFAKRLRAELKVPVGILLPAWGGSSVCAWMSPGSMDSPSLRTLFPDDLIGWRNNVQPFRLYNGMLRPLAPYAVAGVVWYQGETEGTEYQGAYRNAYLYRFLFPAMIADWRSLWGRDDLPFYWIQLPNLRTPRLNWPPVRESQMEALRVPHTAMMPSIDIGDDGNLHPKNKQVFGERMADLVLGKQYGKNTWDGYPTLESAKVEGNALRIRFKDVGKGLKTNDGKAPNAFALAGDDGKYFDAEAKIDGAAEVVVKSKDVNKPVSVRYAWAQAPGVNLFNDAGLPVPPFRTDKQLVCGQEMTWRDLSSKSELATVASGGSLAAAVESADWTASSDGDVSKLLADNKVVIASPNRCEVRILDKPTRGMTDSPTLIWTTKPTGAAQTLSPSKGATAEIMIQSSAGGHPLRGFDLEVGLKQADGKMLHYLISVLPMKLHAFKRNELHVVRADLDNARQRIAYRLAVRPDGVAQLYMDGQRIGLLDGEVIDKPAPGMPEHSFVRIGKAVPEGEYIISIIHAAFDTSGAYAP
jgi:sialate O-acetylesterase